MGITPHKINWAAGIRGFQRFIMCKTLMPTTADSRLGGDDSRAWPFAVTAVNLAG
jgi:hypothetical protein